jgi:hypothetical protein
VDELPNIVTAAQRGDIDAFTELVRRYQDLAFAAAYARLRDGVNRLLASSLTGGSAFERSQARLAEGLAAGTGGRQVGAGDE